MARIVLRAGNREIELGTVDDQLNYKPSGWLNDDAHRWKILEWIDQNLFMGIHAEKGR